MARVSSLPTHACVAADQAQTTADVFDLETLTSSAEFDLVFNEWLQELELEGLGDGESAGIGGNDGVQSAKLCDNFGSTLRALQNEEELSSF